MLCFYIGIHDKFLFVSSQVNARNIDGSTPLCFACSKGCIQSTHLLVKAGAEVNPSLTVTFPPLHEAALNGHVRCIDLLVRLGANLERSENQFGTALHVACLRGYAECARSLLHAGANPNAIKRHQSPLHTAALCGYEECAALLLEYGANVYQRNSQSKRPSDLATDVACKKILLSKAGEKGGVLKLCIVKSILSSCNRRSFVYIFWLISMSLLFSGQAIKINSWNNQTSA